MRRIKLSEGEFYHLYNRGVDKRRVFTSSEEYARFIASLYLMNDVRGADYSHTWRSAGGLASILEAKPPTSFKRLVAIGAYCLMPNHFHLYVTPLVEDGISKFMQRLQTAYTMYFNQKHDRSGSLFQGTFKAEHVARDEYAQYLFSYIHLNPAKLKEPKWKEVGVRNLRGLRDYLRSYPYSSMGEYVERKHVITNPGQFPEFLATVRDIDDHIDAWLEVRDLKISEV